MSDSTIRYRQVCIELDIWKEKARTASPDNKWEADQKVRKLEEEERMLSVQMRRLEEIKESGGFETDLRGIGLYFGKP